MKTRLPFLLLLLSWSAATAQDPFTVEINPVEIVRTTETKRIESMTFGQFELFGESETIEKKETKAPALQVKTSAPARQVAAFNSDFEPAKVYTLAADDFLIVAKPGKYLVIVEGATTAVRPVVIPPSQMEPEPEPLPDPDPNPDPKPDPKPKPEPDLSALEKLSRQLADQLQDAPTRAALATALVTAPQAPTLDQAKTKVQAAVEKTFLDRKGPSLRVDWLEGWRRPVDQRLQSLNLDTLPKYQAAIESVRLGLLINSVSVLQAQAHEEPKYEWRQVLVTHCANGRCYTTREWVRVRVR